MSICLPAACRRLAQACARPPCGHTLQARARTALRCAPAQGLLSLSPVAVVRASRRHVPPLLLCRVTLARRSTARLARPTAHLTQRAITNLGLRQPLPSLAVACSERASSSGAMAEMQQERPVENAGAQNDQDAMVEEATGPDSVEVLQVKRQTLVLLPAVAPESSLTEPSTPRVVNQSQTAARMHAPRPASVPS